jgi:putative ATP-dependent endonuclease of the OLD family
MKLVSTTIADFRSITSAYKVALHDFTVLVGPNNEGKSNVLAAISMALSLLESGLFRLSRQTLRYRYSPGSESYTWDRDYPVRLQQSQPDGESVVTLEFRLTPQELVRFRTQTGVNLSSDLKIKVRFGRQDAKVELLLQGRAKAKLPQSGINAIAGFVAQNTMLKYIPAVRTAGQAEQVINDMLRQRLSVLEADPKYKDLVTEIENLQRPVLAALGSELQKTIAGFVPEIKKVRLSSSTKVIARALRSAAEITIDDGASTPIQMKGDGIKSLLAIALMKHWSEAQLGGRSLILAVEEPESHLHPKAVHRLKEVLVDMAVNSQVILTTHSAPLVDRTVAARNIIVSGGFASPAQSLAAVRDALGIKQSDNLTSAQLILIVEGQEDELVLRSWLDNSSVPIRDALASGDMAFDSMGGCTNLEYKARLHTSNVCSIHAFIDNDEAGRSSYEKAEAGGAINLAECTMTLLPGYKNTELEDLVQVSCYLDAINAHLGLNLSPADISRNDKKLAWSERMKILVEAASKPWTKKVEMRLKQIVCDHASSSPSDSLDPRKERPIKSLIQSLESFLAR